MTSTRICQTPFNAQPQPERFKYHDAAVQKGTRNFFLPLLLFWKDAAIYLLEYPTGPFSPAFQVLFFLKSLANLTSINVGFKCPPINALNAYHPGTLRYPF